jgi:antitoxin VapB
MALSIKDPEADRLARQLAKATGETLTQAIVTSLRERLAREETRKQRDVERQVAETIEIARHCASLPLLDTRSDDEILGYDENGLPT